MKYNYREAMISDILEYISNEINILDFDSREDLAETLNDDLWTYDSVTGNASGSYTFNRQQAKEYVMDNLDDLHTACEDFCLDSATVGEKAKLFHRQAACLYRDQENKRRTRKCQPSI